FPAPASAVDVFVIDTTGGDAARDLTHALREAGIRADRAFDGRSMKAQFKSADRSGAALAIVIGPEELAADKVKLHAMDGTGEEYVGRADLVDRVRKRLQP